MHELVERRVDSRGCICDRCKFVFAFSGSQLLFTQGRRRAASCKIADQQILIGPFVMSKNRTLVERLCVLDVVGVAGRARAVFGVKPRRML
jgi:hypothetical protein